jgi:Caspase domain
MRARIKYFMFLMLLFFSFRGNSITIYEISYEFSKLVDFPKYTAMLVRYGNGTGFMRVRYTNLAKTEIYVVDMEFDEVESRSKIDGLPHLTLQFKGKNPRYIINTSGKKTNEAYNPDVLWFRKRAEDANFKPWGVTSQNEDGTFEHGKMLGVKVMNTADLTRAYVKLYFLPTESFYTNLFNAVADNKPTDTKPTPVSNNKTTPATTPATTAAKIHLILVANTDDLRIGSSVKKDVNTMYSEIKDVSTFLKLPLNYVEISGSKFGKANVEAAINDLKPGTNDIVIFYYSGHGYSNDQQAGKNYPQFDLRQSRFEDILVATLNVADVYEKIKSKNARLNLIFSDCCNSSLGTLKPEGKNFAQTAKSLLSWDFSYCYNLFMKTKGSILATAAKKGQNAYGNTDVGGYFTSNLITSMEKYLSKFQVSNPSWEKIIEEAQTSTVNLSLTNLCTAAISCRQDPVYLLNVN